MFIWFLNFAFQVSNLNDYLVPAFLQLIVPFTDVPWKEFRDSMNYSGLNLLILGLDKVIPGACCSMCSKKGNSKKQIWHFQESAAGVVLPAFQKGTLSYKCYACCLSIWTSCNPCAAKTHVFYFSSSIIGLINCSGPSGQRTHPSLSRRKY